jgi:hypothetical protein
LLGVFAALLSEVFPKREVGEQIIHSPRIQGAIGVLNAALMGLVTLLVLRGVGTGVSRYLGQPEPEWVAGFPYLLVILGTGLGWFLLRILRGWLPLFVQPGPHKAWNDAPVLDAFDSVDPLRASAGSPASSRGSGPLRSG